LAANNGADEAIVLAGSAAEAKGPTLPEKGTGVRRRVVLFLGYLLLPAIVSSGLLLVTNQDREIRLLGFPRHFHLLALGLVVVPSVLLRPSTWQSLALACGDYAGLLAGLFIFSFHTIGSGSDTVFFALLVYAVYAPVGVAMLWGLALAGSALSTYASRRWRPSPFPASKRSMAKPRKNLADKSRLHRRRTTNRKITP
jgi:hypothetical protein